MIHNLTVYCSSSNKVAPIYFDAAAELGRAIAARGWGLVYGGNRIGIMGALADAVRAAGGKVIGITPQLFIDQGYGDSLCDELVVASSMRERKHLLEQRGDALLALPGGLGTLEEILEVIVAKQLGYHQKPIVLLNIAGFYQHLLAMLEHGIHHRFIKPKAIESFFVADTLPAAMKYLDKYIPPSPRPHDSPVNSAAE